MRGGAVRSAGVLAALGLLTACGGTAHAPVSAHAASAQSLANVRVLIDQLRGDIASTAAAGATVAAAAHALRDESDLYALVVAYSDLGGCRAMVRTSGATRPAHTPVALPLARACGYLEHAAALFTRATTADDPRALLAASAEARRASPYLVQARLDAGRAASR
jgi:hypothetical protein